MQGLVTILFLTVTTDFAKLSFDGAEGIHPVIKAVNCTSYNNVNDSFEGLIAAYRSCNENNKIIDKTCMLPCIVKEMGLIIKGQLSSTAASELMFIHFKNIDTARRNTWIKGVTNCFKQYESIEGAIPTEYKDCSHQENGLLNLSTCLLLALDCTMNPTQGYPSVSTNGIIVKQRYKRALSSFGRTVIGGIIGGLIGFPTGVISSFAIHNSQKCGLSGCYKGFCYSYCGLSNDSGDWCYTTKTHSQSFEYVKCSSNAECDGCWKCAGSCTI